jgi:hypothetical protein
MPVPSEGWESRWKRHLAQIADSAVGEPEQGWRRAMGGRTFALASSQQFSRSDFSAPPTSGALNMPLGA